MRVLIWACCGKRQQEIRDTFESSVGKATKIQHLLQNFGQRAFRHLTYSRSRRISQWEIKNII